MWEKFKAVNGLHATCAQNKIARLNEIVTRSVEVELLKDVKQIITGSVQNPNGELGFLDLIDIANLAAVSWTWLDVAQPMIDAANQWRHSDVLYLES